MNEIIEQLKQAVNISPENIPLRLHLAEMMIQQNLLIEASEQFSTVLKREHSNTKALSGLAEIYYRQSKYSAAIILFEQLQQQNALSFDNKIKFVRCLLKENSVTQAKEIYAQALKEQPNFRDTEIDTVLRTAGVETGMDADSLLEELATSGKFFYGKTLDKISGCRGHA